MALIIAVTMTGVGGGQWISGMESAQEKKRAGEAKVSCGHTQPFLTSRGVGSWVANFFGVTPPFVTRELVHKLAPQPQTLLVAQLLSWQRACRVGSCSFILRRCNLRR